MVSVKRKSIESLAPSSASEGAGKAGETSGVSKKSRPAAEDTAAAAAPSSVPVSSALVIPNKIDASKLPNGWEGIVRAELNACGLGAEEEYQRQLEAYDSSDDEAGEPPTPPPTRKRMAGDMLAKHYKVSQSAAKVFVKIVDINLERAGINTSRSIFTEDDDRLVEELVAKDLEESGKTRVRRGFWERIHKEYFAGRGFTAEMLISRRRNRVARKNQKPKEESRSSTVHSMAPTDETSSTKANANDDDHDSPSENRFTDADFKLMTRLVQKEIEETNGDRVRHSFWGKVVEDHFAGRGLTACQVQDHYKSKKKRQMKVTNGAKKTRAVSDPFTDAEDVIIKEAVAQHKRECGSEKLPLGFWPSVIKKYSMRRDAPQLSKRWYILRKTNTGNTNAGVDVPMPRQSSSKRTTTAALAGEDKEVPNGDGEEEKTALPRGFTDEEYHSMERLVQEELKVTGSQRVRPGFWDGVLQKSFSDRNITSKALCKYYSKIKSLKMGEKSAVGDDHNSVHSTSSIAGEGVSSVPEQNSTPAVEGGTTTTSISDTVPLTNELIVLPSYQATTAKYAPQSRVIYRPSSGESDIIGRVLEVGICPSLDNLYVYTIAEDAGGQQHERIPEQFLQQR